MRPRRLPGSATSRRARCGPGPRGRGRPRSARSGSSSCLVSVVGSELCVWKRPPVEGEGRSRGNCCADESSWSSRLASTCATTGTASHVPSVPERLARRLADEHDVDPGRDDQAGREQLEQEGHVPSPFRDQESLWRRPPCGGDRPVEATALWRRPPCGGDRPADYKCIILRLPVRCCQVRRQIAAGPRSDGRSDQTSAG